MSNSTLSPLGASRGGEVLGGGREFVFCFISIAIESPKEVINVKDSLRFCQPVVLR